MKITLYRSILCPRCHMAGKYLRDMAEEDPSLTIKEVEVTTQPVKTWKQGIHSIPTLQVGRQTLSGIYLTRERIKKFIEQSKLQTNS